MNRVHSLESALITDYAFMTARSVLLSKEGKAAGYWEKPLFGRPRVSGSAYVMGTYTWFILGCSVAGLRRESAKQIPLLQEAESLVGYYLEYPLFKPIMDAHWKSANEYASRTLPPELVDSMGSDMRSLLTQSQVGISRADETVLAVFWEIARQRPGFTIEVGIHAFAGLFVYGTCLPPGEVKRLWGIQAQNAVVPYMERPFEDVQAETAAEISSRGR